MDSKAKGFQRNNGMRTRSFRDEDYTNRRVFLRSYPLDWELGGDDKNHKEAAAAGGGGSTDKMRSMRTGKDDCSSGRSEKPMIRRIILSVFHWGGGKVLVLRRFKNKLAIYVISCIPIGFKPPTTLISG
ncbi:hypothetical protein ACFX16_030434 [Malus domestica]